MFAFTTIISWFSSNLKFLVIGAAVIASFGVLTKLYNTIQENGANRIVIQSQQASLAAKDKVIEAQEKQRLLMEYVLQARDQEIQQLNDKMENLTDNLGDDVDDQAADSIKELIKRLSQ